MAGEGQPRSGCLGVALMCVECETMALMEFVAERHADGADPDDIARAFQRLVWRVEGGNLVAQIRELQ